MAEKAKVAWNKNKTGSVVLAKLKEFTILQQRGTEKYEVRGWFNHENSFLFGTFDDRREAEIFLDTIHKMF